MARTSLSALAAGMLFGVGLTVSGMVQPLKVVGFLDVAGAWDPTLGFVMGGALAVSALAFPVILRRGRPLWAEAFSLPTRQDLDARLIAGSMLFGIGWGLGGFCPGPALASLALGAPGAWIFAAAMAAGLLLHRLVFESGGRPFVKVQHFFDEATATLSYVVWDEQSRIALLIDSVLDFDPKSGRTSTRSCQAIADFLAEQRLSLGFVLDTHAHADHLTGMPFFRERYRAKTGIGAEIRQVQAIFRKVFNLGDALRVDGSQFDVLLGEGDVLEVGPLRVEAFHTPGHTPACMSYRIGDALFVGDTLFMPDYGTARCDFPGGSAGDLYDSIQRLYALPDATRVFTCHDYRPGGRPLRFQSTIGEEKRENVQLSHATTRAAYVEFRRIRDATLEMPTLILPSIQVNIRAGRFPEPESNGVSYLKIPLNAI